MINRKLIFIQSTFGDAHQMIRYNELRKNYKNSELMAFDRDYYSMDQPITYVSLGKVDHGSYYKRIYIYIRAIHVIKKRLSKDLKNDIFFYGFDLLPILSISKFYLKSRLIFEVLDLREVFFKNSLMSKFFIELIKYSMRNVSILVVTSDLFLTRFFKKHNAFINKSFVIENKVHLEDKAISTREIKSEIITIGYFGLIRCKRSIQILLKVLENCKNIRLIIHGYFVNISEELKENLLSNPNVNYKGEYRSPEDLDRMYQEIDINWIAYPYSEERDGNFRYARTNRFYESGFFLKPMIANIESADAERVTKNNYGIVLNLGDINGSVQEICKISFSQLELFVENIEKTDKYLFQSSNNDYKFLLKELCSS